MHEIDELLVFQDTSDAKISNISENANAVSALAAQTAALRQTESTDSSFEI